MAHKKGEGSTANGRDSISKRLGVKLFGGQGAVAGNIIVKQRGTKFHAGENVYMGKDYTIHAAIDGTVQFRKGRRDRTFVSVLPFSEVIETVVPVQPVVIQNTPVSKPGTADEPIVTQTVVSEPEVQPEVPASVENAAPVVMESAAPAVEENTASVEKTAPKPKKEKAAKKEAEPAAAEEAEAKPVSKKTTKSAGKDDLKIIEGIGPKIATLLSEAGITTFSELASTGPEKISEILSDAGSRYKMHDPTTWPQQAALAAEGKWEELKVLQDSLKGGKAE